jgi:biotin carboxyl carrier protein
MTPPLAVDRDDNGDLVVRAPGVGLWGDHPVDGTLVGPGSSGGTLRRLCHVVPLILPEGVAGQVMLPPRRDRIVPVEFGEVLFRVRASGIDAARPAETGSTSAAAAGSAHVVAPTDGVFYRSPSQGAPPFVSPGDRLVTGQAVGLIEVMKTFNPIAYDGADGAEVVAILAEDGREVRAGQPLVAIR